MLEVAALPQSCQMGAGGWGVERVLRKWRWLDFGWWSCFLNGEFESGKVAIFDGLCMLLLANLEWMVHLDLKCKPGLGQFRKEDVKDTHQFLKTILEHHPGSTVITWSSLVNITWFQQWFNCVKQMFWCQTFPSLFYFFSSPAWVYAAEWIRVT